QDRRLDLEHATLVEELADRAVEPGAELERRAAGARAPVAHPCSRRNAVNASSSRMRTPSSSALASFEPASEPATTKLVFFETLPATLAPSASSFSFACSRE